MAQGVQLDEENLHSLVPGFVQRNELYCRRKTNVAVLLLKRKDKKRRSQARRERVRQQQDGESLGQAQRAGSPHCLCGPSFVYDIYSEGCLVWVERLKEELSLTLGSTLCNPGTRRRWGQGGGLQKEVQL